MMWCFEHYNSQGASTDSHRCLVTSCRGHMHPEITTCLGICQGKRVAAVAMLGTEPAMENLCCVGGVIQPGMSWDFNLKNMLHFPIRLHLQKTNSEIKLRFSEFWPQSIKLHLKGTFWAWGSDWLQWLHTHEVITMLKKEFQYRHNIQYCLISHISATNYWPFVTH